MRGLHLIGNLTGYAAAADAILLNIVVPLDLRGQVVMALEGRSRI